MVSLRVEAGGIAAEVQGRGRELAPLTSDFTLPAAALIRAGERLGELSLVFRETGGTHVAALFPSRGAPIHAEDVSRHCALDKAIGAAFLAGLEFPRAFLVVSFRLSSRLVEKAAWAGIPVVASLSAPTLQAAKLAEALGVTLGGFLRGGRFNIYSHPGRIGL